MEIMAETRSFTELAQAKDAEIEMLKHQQAEMLAKMNRLISKNWIPLLGGWSHDDDGPSLEQTKDAAARIREMAALDGIVKNGLKARTAHIWRGGIHYDGVRGRKQGKGVDVRARINNPVNQRNFFGATAHEEREAALYSDSQPFYVGDERDWTIRQIPISEITADYRNPEYSGEIWAYRRAWMDYTKDAKGEKRVEWIWVNAFWDKRTPRIQYNNEAEPVALKKRMFGDPVNSNVGWGYGTADALAAIRHASEYDAAMNAGLDVTEGLARIIGSLKNNDPAGAKDAAVKVGANGAFGNLAATGLNNEIMMFQTAGNAYDFNRLLPVLARFASAIGVSVIEVSANPGNAGGSYGAARSMTPVTEAMVTSRREYHVALDREVLLWLGAKADELDVWFDPIIAPTEKYRAEQIIESRMGTGLYKGIEIKRMHAVLDGRNPDLVTEPPEGWMLPNNENSGMRRDIDPNLSGTGADPSKGGDFAPTQGSGARALKTGSGDQNAADIRGNQERLEKMLEEIDSESLLERMERMITLLEAVKDSTE